MWFAQPSQALEETVAVVSRLDGPKPEDQAEALKCPLLKVVSSEEAGKYPRGVKCERRRGRERVPSRDEVEWFCINGSYLSCPTFRRSRGL